VPTVFRWDTDESDTALLERNTLQVSRITAVLLIIAYFVFVWFQARSHHSIYDAIFEYDEARDVCDIPPETDLFV
jgi:Ca2+:H+ antiporter